MSIPVIGMLTSSKYVFHWIEKGSKNFMALKIKIDNSTYECPACGYRWSKNMGMADLAFDEDERCPCCPDCGELIEDGDEY